MAFTVEDGTQVVGANAYASVSQVDAYLTDRGRQDEGQWSSIGTAGQEVAIIKATDYMDKRWGRRYRGARLGGADVQGLLWPRCGAYDDDGFAYPEDAIPPRLIRALAEYAVRAAAGELLVDPFAVGVVQDRDVKRKTEKVGPIEDTTEYFSDPESSSTGLGPDVSRYPAADLLMAELVTGDPLAAGLIQFGRVVRA